MAYENSERIEVALKKTLLKEMKLMLVQIFMVWLSVYLIITME